MLRSLAARVRRRLVDAFGCGRREMSILFETSVILSKERDPERIAQRLIEAMERLLGYEYGAVLMLNAETGFLEPLALSCQGKGPGFLRQDKAYVRDKKLTPSTGITGWVVQNGQAVRSGDVRKDSRYFGMRDAIRSELCVPLLAMNRVLGALNVETRKSHAYGQRDQDILTALAGPAAVALDNARLYAELSRHSSALELKVKQLTEAEQRLTDLLAEKDILMRELFHRTTNTLQVVDSLLRLQAASWPGNAGVDQLVRDTENRILAISLVHDMLYRAGDLSRLDMAAYVREFSTQVWQSWVEDLGRIALHVDADSARLILDAAIPCGLILNEMLSNTFRHAFPGGLSGNVWVTLTHDDKTITLMVRDDGCGLAPGQEDPRATGGEPGVTTGMQVIRALAESQLKAAVEMRSGPGVSWTVRFPLPDYEERV